MKKILASLLVLALCAPAMAATVTADTSTAGQAVITVAAEGAVNIVGLALNVDIVSGTVDGCTVDTATFNIYPDAAFSIIDGGGTYGYGDGTPVASQDAAGEADTSASFAVCAGALNGETTAGATGSASVQITITAAAGATVNISENALRGGIVLTDGTGEDITTSGGVVNVVIAPAAVALCPGDVTATKTGYIPPAPPTFVAGFDMNLWDGANGVTDTTDLQAVILLLANNGNSYTLSGTSDLAAAADVTTSKTGYIPPAPPTFVAGFDMNLWDGTNGVVDTTDLQALILLLANNGNSYTCP